MSRLWNILHREVDMAVAVRELVKGLTLIDVKKIYLKSNYEIVFHSLS